MATLYITEQGSTLRKDYNRLLVERDGTTLAEIHDFKVERVVIFGNVQLTTQAMSFLLDRGIDTALLTCHGRLKGRLAALESKNIPLRLRQFESLRDPAFVLKVAKAIVKGKLENSSEVLARHQRNHPECNLGRQMNQLTAVSHTVGRCQTVDILRGIEGQAASIYFQGFARMLRRGIPFKHRTRRPPTDPVNSLLGLAYTLLYNEAIGALVSLGADPYLGFYHSVHYGRCSLASDLIEEMRAVAADRLTLNMVNLEVVKPHDFVTNGDGGVHLTDDGRKRFLREYERTMTSEFQHRQTGEQTSLRRALHSQAAAMQRVILQSAPYEAFRGWH